MTFIALQTLSECAAHPHGVSSDSPRHTPDNSTAGFGGGVLTAAHPRRPAVASSVRNSMSASRQRDRWRCGAATNADSAFKAITSWPIDRIGGASRAGSLLRLRHACRLRQRDNFHALWIQKARNETAARVRRYAFAANVVFSPCGGAVSGAWGTSFGRMEKEKPLDGGINCHRDASTCRGPAYPQVADRCGGDARGVSPGSRHLDRQCRAAVHAGQLRRERR